MKNFWLSPSAKIIPVKHHFLKAREILNRAELPSNEAIELLLLNRYLRCVMTETDLFFERRYHPTYTQMKELKDIAIEKNVRLELDKSVSVTSAEF